MTRSIGNLIIITFLLISVPSYSHEPEVLDLVSPNFPPYTYQHNQVITGLGTELVKKVLAETDIPYKITMVEDYGTAIYAIKAKLADGIFLASQNEQRNAIATFTLPLIINKWSWFVLKDFEGDPKSEAFKSQANIGTIIGTNTHKWLKSNSYTVSAHPIDAASLAAMLKSRRIDAVFIAEAVFEHAIDEDELSLFKKVLEVEQPFGMYISHDYLKAFPNALPQINNSIKKIIYSL
jgi:ABC-type amino acid transport substrate-binding protein